MYKFHVDLVHEGPNYHLFVGYFCISAVSICDLLAGFPLRGVTSSYGIIHTTSLWLLMGIFKFILTSVYMHLFCMSIVVVQVIPKDHYF